MKPKDISVQRSRLKARRRIKPVPTATQEEQDQLLSMLKESGAKPVVLSCFNGYSESFHWKRKPKLPKLPASLRSLYSPGNCELTDGEAQPISNIMFNKDTSVQSSKFKARRRIMVVPTASHQVQDQLKMQVFNQLCSVVVMDTQNHSIVEEKPTGKGIYRGSYMSAHVLLNFIK